jgi:2-keto-3-deoxy-L-rhamnonate aldolase RhmA
VGGLALDAATAKTMIDKGYRLIITGFDVLFLQRAAGEILGGIRGDRR